MSKKYKIYLPLVMKGTLPKILGTCIEGTIHPEYVAPKAWILRVVRWWEIEETKNNIVWTPKLLSDWNYLHNRRVIWQFKDCAVYARKFPTYPDSPPKKKYYNNFARACNAFISKFNVTHIEIWNEPEVDPTTLSPELRNYIGGWGLVDDPVQGGVNYGEFLKVIYPIIKQAHPETTVLAGALMMCSEPFIKGFTSVAKNYDAVSYHAYAHWYWDNQDLILTHKKILRKYTDAPLFCTETSLMNSDSNPVFEEDQAKYWDYVIGLASDIGLEGLNWYSMDSGWECTNMIDGSRKKPVWYEYYTTLS